MPYKTTSKQNATLYHDSYQVPSGALKVPTDKLEDIMGEHNTLIKKMLSSLNKGAEETKEGDSFEELVKSLVCSPLTGYAFDNLNLDISLLPWLGLRFLLCQF